MCRALLSALALLATSSGAPAQSTWFVDVNGIPPGSGTPADPYTSIQFAIDQPTTGPNDRVRIAPGTYFERIDLSGKSLVLSAATPGTAILDGQGAGTVVTMDSGQGSSTALIGLRIQNGSNPAGPGGGLLLSDGCATLRACTIADCSSTGGGAGLYAESANLLLEDCRIEDNVSTANGGGVACHQAGFVATRTSLSRNSASGGGAEGGGLSATQSTIDLRDCDLSDNRGLRGGGALWTLDCDTTILDSRFERNRVDGPPGGGGSAGAGTHIAGSTCIAGSTYRDNFAGFGGGEGGALNLWSPTVIEDSLFECNAADSEINLGGAIFSAVETTQIRSTCFVGNLAAGAGALAAFSGTVEVSDCRLERNVGQPGAIAGNAIVRSSLFLGNSAGGSTGSGTSAASGIDADRCTFVGNTSAASGSAVHSSSLVNCIVWGNSPGQLDASCTATYSDVEGGFPGTGNIDADPALADPGFNSFWLTPGSPCIDAGDPGALADLDGTRADIGAIPFCDCNSNRVLDLVDVNSGQSQDLNGNGRPDECECIVHNYCDRFANSVSPKGAQIASLGTSSLARADLVLVASGCPAGISGRFFFAPNQGRFLFGDGLYCAAGQTTRLPVIATDGQGRTSFGFDALQASVAPGTGLSFQFWYRDPAGPGGSGFNTTDGLRVVFCP